jgi:hypothetical protein
MTPPSVTSAGCRHGLVAAFYPGVNKTLSWAPCVCASEVGALVISYRGGPDLPVSFDGGVGRRYGQSSACRNASSRPRKLHF